MSRVVFIEDRCKGCLLCTTVCPVHIIEKSQRFNRQGYQVVEVPEDKAELCTGCASCGTICPDVAVRVFKSARKAKGDKA